MNKNNIIQVFKFTLFSISAGIIQILSFELLYDIFKMTYWPAYLISLLLSVVWNFTLNRKFTFKSANNIPLAMLLVAVYYAVFTPLSTWWGHELEKIGIAGILVTIFSMLVNFVTEFLYQKFVVFRNSIDTNNLAKSTEDKQFEKILKILKNDL